MVGKMIGKMQGVRIWGWFCYNSALFINLQIQNIKNIQTLINSSASNNFIDSQFAIDNGFTLQNLQNPIRLTLFDGSAASHSSIQQSCTLEVDFPCGAQHSICFLLTLLDRSASVVLGFTWLICHNPLIDWIQHKITFHSHLHRFLPTQPVAPRIQGFVPSCPDRLP